MKLSMHINQMKNKKIGLIALIMGLIVLIVVYDPIRIGTGAQVEKMYVLDVQYNDVNLYRFDGSGPRNYNTIYWNNNSFPIMVIVNYQESYYIGHEWNYYNFWVNNTKVVAKYYDTSKVGDFWDGFSFIVPARSSYRLNIEKRPDAIDWYEWNMIIKQV